jgi:hypothetical protein
MHKYVNNRWKIVIKLVENQNSLKINKILYLVVIAPVGTQYIGEALFCKVQSVKNTTKI